MKFLEGLKAVGEKIKTRWEIQSYWQMAVIFIVFGITGSSAVKLAAPVLSLFRVDDNLSPWIYWPIRIVVIFPLYQILLVLFGWLFGQFDFFWKIEKKMISRFAFKKRN